MEGRKYSDLDVSQINRLSYDPEAEATRVIIVGTDAKIDIKLDEIKLPEQKVIEVPVIIKEKDVQIVEIPVQTIIREVHVEQIPVQTYVEIPKIVEIEKPFIIKERETEIRTVEIPVIIREKEEYIPKYVYFTIGLLALTNILTIIFMRG